MAPEISIFSFPEVLLVNSLDFIIILTMEIGI